MPGDGACNALCSVVAVPGLLLQETSWIAEATAFHCNSVKATCKASPWTPSMLQAKWSGQMIKESSF